MGPACFCLSMQYLKNDVLRTKKSSVYARIYRREMGKNKENRCCKLCFLAFDDV